MPQPGIPMYHHKLNALRQSGFGPLGPGANSLASATQSTLGNAVRGSEFANNQRLGMLGYGVDLPSTGIMGNTCRMFGVIGNVINLTAAAIDIAGLVKEVIPKSEAVPCKEKKKTITDRASVKKIHLIEDACPEKKPTTKTGFFGKSITDNVVTWNTEEAQYEFKIDRKDPCLPCWVSVSPLKKDVLTEKQKVIKSGVFGKNDTDDVVYWDTEEAQYEFKIDREDPYLIYWMSKSPLNKGDLPLKERKPMLSSVCGERIATHG